MRGPLPAVVLGKGRCMCCCWPLTLLAVSSERIEEEAVGLFVLALSSLFEPLSSISCASFTHGLLCSHLSLGLERRREHKCNKPRKTHRAQQVDFGDGRFSSFVSFVGSVFYMSF